MLTKTISVSIVYFDESFIYDTAYKWQQETDTDREVLS